MKNQGITILQLVISVIIMIILAAVAVFYGQGIPREANLASIYNETKELKSALQEAAMLNKLKVVLVQGTEKLDVWDKIQLEKLDEDKKGDYAENLGENASENIFYLDFTSSRELQTVLELENMTHDYLLDFNDLNVFLVKGVSVETKEGPKTLYNAKNIEEYYNNIYQR